MLGECFKHNAMKFIEDPVSPKYKLVHAVVTGESHWKNGMADRKFTHCWIECPDWVYDYTEMDSPARYDKKMFYEGMKPQFIVRLSQHEVIMRVKSSGHFGHWRQHPEHIHYSAMPLVNANHRRFADA